MITGTDILKFKRLYLEHFNVELNEDTARNELAKLVRIVEITKNEMKDGSEQKVETLLSE